MRKLIYILPLILLYSCGGTGGGIVTEKMGPKIFFNVRNNNDDTCRCKANKFKPDTTFGYYCSAIDSLLISFTKDDGQKFDITDSLGFTKKHIMPIGPTKFYFIKKGFTTAYATIDFSSRARSVVRVYGCEVLARRLADGLYYYTVIINRAPKKGVRIVPYTAK